MYSQVYYQYPYETVDKNGNPDPEGEYRKFKENEPMELVLIPKPRKDSQGNLIESEPKTVSLGGASVLTLNRLLNVGRGEGGKVYPEELPDIGNFEGDAIFN